MINKLLRAEGLAQFLGATFLYWQMGASWFWFAALFFLPDISFAAYLGGPKAGAFIYNALHTIVGPLILYVVGLAFGWTTAMAPIALIWLAHIGFDRALGYGLKYFTSFNDTHLGRIGRN